MCAAAKPANPSACSRALFIKMREKCFKIGLKRFKWGRELSGTLQGGIPDESGVGPVLDSSVRF